jgi:hypothetical protein
MPLARQIAEPNSRAVTLGTFSAGIGVRYCRNNVPGHLNATIAAINGRRYLDSILKIGQTTDADSCIQR